MNDPSSRKVMNIGLSSLMVVFLALCLITFAILSLSGARSDYNLSQKFAEHKTRYYQASSEAELILADIDTRLAELKEAANGEDSAYFSAVQKAFSQDMAGDPAITLSMEGEEPVLSYAVPLDENHRLGVELRVCSAGESTRYEILSWQSTASGDWEGDNTLQLIR